MPNPNTWSFVICDRVAMRMCLDLRFFFHFAYRHNGIQFQMAIDFKLYQSDKWFYNKYSDEKQNTHRIALVAAAFIALSSVQKILIPLLIAQARILLKRCRHK